MSARTRRGFAVLLVACVAAAAACESKPPPKPSPGALVEQYLAQGNRLEAMRESERLVRANPRNAELRMVAARANEAQGDLDRAMEHLAVAEELDPTNGEAVIRMGEIDQKRNRMDDAYISFRRAISVAPNDVRAWKGMAMTAEALGFDAEAEKAYTRWAELEKAQGLTGNTD
jgi:tetratricopeptide (TPR) repeat protein